MPAGWELWTEDGLLQGSSEMIGYTMRKTGSSVTQSRVGGNTTPSTILVPKTGMSARAKCAVQVLGYCAGLVGQSQNAAGEMCWNFACNAPVGTPFNFFIYEWAAEIPPSNFGLEAYNEAGQITFSANYRPMSGVALLGTPQTFWPGGGFSGYFDGPTTFSLPGKSLAVFNAAWAGHRRAGLMRCSNGNRPPCTNYVFTNNGKVYGGTVSADGSTVNSGQISWDDVTVNNGNSDTPPADFDITIPLKLFVVDVTGAPIGTTFF